MLIAAREDECGGKETFHARHQRAKRMGDGRIVHSTMKVCSWHVGPPHHKSKSVGVIAWEGDNRGWRCRSVALAAGHRFELMHFQHHRLLS